MIVTSREIGLMQMLLYKSLLIRLGKGIGLMTDQEARKRIGGVRGNIQDDSVEIESLHKFGT